eukprot:177307_1
MSHEEEIPVLSPPPPAILMGTYFMCNEYDKTKHELEQLINECIQLRPTLRNINEINKSFIPQLIEYTAQEIILPLLKPIINKNEELKNNIKNINNYNNTQNKSIKEWKQYVEKK